MAVTHSQTQNRWRFVPGVVFCAMLGGGAIVISQATGFPPLMLAVIIGISLHGLAANPVLKDGVCWTGHSLLYIGVALHGLRIDIADLASAGWISASIVIGVLGLTILFGVGFARLLKQDRTFGILMSGAVAICGTSAAAAICSALPKCEERDRQLAITIAGITGLSTLAMFVYPVIANTLDLSDAEAGLFFGGSIHNVSQALGAGYSVSGETGDITTVLKMLRVSMLLPIVFLISVLSTARATGQGASAPSSIGSYFPPFLIVFAILAVINCLQLVPAAVADWGNQAAQWALIVSLAAIGMSTSIAEVFAHGKRPLFVMTITTGFMAAAILTSLYVTRSI